MNVLIDSVRVANFRSLRNIEVDLGSITMLVGMNNAGKTSFLRAVQLALGADRRQVVQEDFFATGDGHQEPDRILIDVRIVPVDGAGQRVGEFAAAWSTTELGGDIIRVDSDNREYVAMRTDIRFYPLRNGFPIDRFVLKEWRAFTDWQETPATRRASPRFERIVAFLIDAQRDVVTDLRDRGSYVGHLLSNVDVPVARREAIEQQITKLNEEIVAASPVLEHLRGSLADLNNSVGAEGTGVEVTPVSRKLRDLTRGLSVYFGDSPGSSFPVEYHGMGTRSWAALLTYRAYIGWLARQTRAAGNTPYHAILALEEPEAHLHPNAQRQVYSQMAQFEGQKIVSTHSPYVAAQAALSELRCFRKVGAETTVTALDPGNLTPEDIRKVRRVVLNTRGELLFAKAVVLFEGETEEQALPIFARVYLNHEPAALGLCFVGVGGDGNYAPFLRVLNAAQTPWFIFSDGEEKTRARVQNALRAVGIGAAPPHVVTLPNDCSIERYLLEHGYGEQLRGAVVLHCCPPTADARHVTAKRSEVGSWSNEKLLDYVLGSGKKVQLAPLWAQQIVDIEDLTRRYPIAVHELLKMVNATLHGGGEAA
jgi:putative ATP-dependent endonuclease of the OLD family